MKNQMAIEIGMGTDLRGEDGTKAACRAVKDALHRNSLTVAPALGFPREAMLVDIRVGVPNPETVDTREVAKCAPYGVVSVEAVKGGLSVDHYSESATIIASAIVSVSFDVEAV